MTKSRREIVLLLAEKCKKPEPTEPPICPICQERPRKQKSTNHHYATCCHPKCVSEAHRISGAMSGSRKRQPRQAQEKLDPAKKMNKCLGYKFGTKEQCEAPVPAPRHFCQRCRELQTKYPSGSTWWGSPI